MEITNETKDRANAVLNATDVLEQRLAGEEANVVFIQENINNASVIITGLPDRGEPGQNIFEFVWYHLTTKKASCLLVRQPGDQYLKSLLRD